MNKRLKKFLKAHFSKRLVEEQKVIKIVKRAHRKEQNLLNRLLEDNCDNEVINQEIKALMKQEISNGIAKTFANQKVFFDIPAMEIENENLETEKEENCNNFKQKDVTEVKKEKKHLWNFLHKNKGTNIENIVSINQSEKSQNLLTYDDKIDYSNIIDEQNVANNLQENQNIIETEILEDTYVETPNNYWIINTLSGYKNDKNKIENQSTSLCFVKEGIIVFSAVFDWYKRNTYYAIKGMGAYQDNMKIRVSQTKKTEDAIVSFRIGSKGLNDNIELQKLLVPLTKTMQSHSNIAVAMCNVASGKIDVCVDVAVNDLVSYKIGKLIVEEAGGKVTDFSGNEFINSNSIVSANETIHKNILPIIKSKLVTSSLKKVWKITRTALKIVAAII